jgi:hypothetical protein
VKTGTLAAILVSVAAHLGMDRDALIKAMKL